MVGNETNKNRRTINRERKLLPQIKHKFLVEEWFCDIERSLLREDINRDLGKVSTIQRCRYNVSSI